MTQTIANIGFRREWHEAFKELGFRAAPRGAGFRHNGLSVKPDSGWLTATAATSGGGDALAGQLDKPGLWKQIGEGKAARRQFDLRLAAIGSAATLGEDGQEAADPLESCIAWAAATALEDLPAGWECPPREEVESWIPAEGLTLRCGELVRQGTLVCQPDRLALRMPLVNEIPVDLPEARGEWLRAVLLDAHNRWRMVRIGIQGPAERRSVVAEVDLSGVPAAVAEAFVKAGLDALRWVVSWLVRSAGLVADARIALRLCEIGPERA